MNADDRAAGRSLGEMAQLAKSLGGRRLNITISVGMERKTGLHTRIKDNVLALLQNVDSPVVRALVSGRETEDGQTEVVDLLLQKLTSEQTVKLGQDRRFPYEARRKALKRAYDQWKRLLER